MFLGETAMYSETTLAVEAKASLPVVPYNGSFIHCQISSRGRLVLTFAGLNVISQFFQAMHNVLDCTDLVMSVKNIMEFPVTLGRMTIEEHASECSVGRGTIQHNIVYGKTSFT